MVMTFYIFEMNEYILSLSLFAEQMYLSSLSKLNVKSKSIFKTK